MSRTQRLLLQLTRRIWFRAALFSVSAVVLALMAAVLAPFVPAKLGVQLGAKAVDNILEILASSMLAVTTFSVSSMVQAYSGAASNITPRATRLLIEDSTAQNALSTFIGAFLFSIVGICALATGAYGDNGRVVLFAGSLVVIAFIVFTLLRWVEHLSHFGRMLETIERVEKSARAAACTLAHRPHLGAAPESGWAPDAVPVKLEKTGYITHVDVPRLKAIAGRNGLQVHVMVGPGAFVSPDRVVLRIEGDPAPQVVQALVRAFSVEDSRAFDQDPRFGLVVLSEIASRALSPAVNDPGSAIAVVGAGLRVLEALLTTPPDPPFPKRGPVHLPAPALADLLEDLFRPIARDGASLIEVDLQVQKALGALKEVRPDAAPLFQARAADALERAEAALESEADRRELREAYAARWG